MIEEIIKNAVNKILNMDFKDYEVFGSFTVYFYKDSNKGPVWDIIDNNEMCIGKLYADNYNNDDEFTKDLLKIIF